MASMEDEIKALEEWISQLEKEKEKALLNTLNAKTSSMGLFSDVWGDEWFELSEEERIVAIEEEHEREVENIQKEIDKLAEEIEELDKASAWWDKAEKICRIIQDKLDEEDFDASMRESHTTYSFYFLADKYLDEDEEEYTFLKIRVSDHEQPEGGGMIMDKYGNWYRSGEADAEVIIEKDGLEVFGLEKALDLIENPPVEE